MEERCLKKGRSPVTDTCTLATLYYRIDAPDSMPEDILALFADDLEWEFSLPDRTVGGGLSDFRAFLEKRAGSTGSHASHSVAMAHRAGRMETLFGALMLDTASSPFVAAAEIDAAERIRRLMMRRSGALVFGAAT